MQKMQFDKDKKIQTYLIVLSIIFSIFPLGVLFIPPRASALRFLLRIYSELLSPEVVWPFSVAVIFTLTAYDLYRRFIPYGEKHLYRFIAIAAILFSAGVFLGEPKNNAAMVVYILCIFIYASTVYSAISIAVYHSVMKCSELVRKRASMILAVLVCFLLFSHVCVTYYKLTHPPCVTNISFGWVNALPTPLAYRLLGIPYDPGGRLNQCPLGSKKVEWCKTHPCLQSNVGSATSRE